MSDGDTYDDQLVREAIRLLNKEYEAEQDFNEYFNGDESIRIGQLEFPRSRVLFWLDRAAYYEAQEDWADESLQERHADCLKLLNSNGHQAPFRELADAVARQRIVPFVGAGLSEPMGMPLWGAALRMLHDRISNPNDPAVSALIDGGRYLDAAEALAGQSQILTENFIRTTYRVQKVLGAVLLIPHIAHGCIVTTNFDDAIEEVFKLEEISFDAYMHGTQHHNFFSRLVRGQRCLLKLHGDADDPQTYILTKTQYLEAYEEPLNFQCPLPKALRQIYISNSLLFLGCSLEQDRTLDLFKKVKQQGEYEIPHHFAFIEMPDSVPKKLQKETALLELHIQPIWYPSGRHEYVEKLLSLAVDVANKRITLNL